MSIIFNPTGTLNVSQDPSDLPESADQFNIQSGAMVRCKNLRIDQKGIAKTRDGCTILTGNFLAPIWLIEQQSSKVYVFNGTRISTQSDGDIKTGLTSAQWSAIKYNAYNSEAQNIFALNGTDRKRIEGTGVYEWGLEPPTDAPVNTGGGAGVLTGIYNTKYTYVRKESSVVVAESNPSPAGNAVTLAAQGFSLLFTQPTDPQVTHIRIYRTQANGDEYFFDQDLVVTTIGAVCSQADADLGDLLEEDHDRPPLGSFVIGPAYDGTCFIIKDNLLYYCKPKQPEYWPALYYIEVSTRQLPGKTAVFHNGQLFFITSDEIYYIQGTGSGTFFPLPMKAKTGAQSVRGAVSVAGRGIYHIGFDGIYLFSSGTDTKITEEALEPLFRGEDVQGMPGVSGAFLSECILYTYRNYLYFIYMSDSDVAGPSNVLVFNMDTQRLSYFVYSNSGDPIEITAVHAAIDGTYIYAGDSSGDLWSIENRDATDDNGDPIEFEIQSKDFILATRRHFPRWVKYDVNASDADTCQGEFLLGGATLHTHTITGNRDTRRRLVEADNGNRAAFRISGTGVVSIYGVESE